MRFRVQGQNSLNGVIKKGTCFWGAVYNQHPPLNLETPQKFP